MTHRRPQIVAAAFNPPTDAIGAGRRRAALRIRRAGLVAFFALLSFVTSPATTSAQSRIAQLSGLERSIVARVNALRARHGLVPLRHSAGLTAAARHHSREMASRGYFGHRSPDGGAFDRRIARFYSQDAHRYWSVGENLLWASGEMHSAKEAVDTWLRSTKHRAIMLQAHWRQLGVGAVLAYAAPGVYRGADVTILTADFGVRR